MQKLLWFSHEHLLAFIKLTLCWPLFKFLIKLIYTSAISNFVGYLEVLFTRVISTRITSLSSVFEYNVKVLK